MKKIISYVVLSVVSVFGGMSIEHTINHNDKKVCHSQTEDSTPYDCNFDKGAWVPWTNK